MRLFLFITAISVMLPSIGCNSSLKCRRETALLRAEYLDLEDKYYALLSNSGTTSTPTIAGAIPTASSGVIVADSQPIMQTVPQPMIYGSGVQSSVGINNTMPEIIYYDQSGGHPVQGYPVQGYPVQGETYYSSPQYGQTPTLASPSDFNAPNSQDSYYPSPVENMESSEVNSNPSQTEDLPVPDANLDDDQSRFDLELEDTHEIGHEIKIDLSSPITEVVINKSVSQGKNTDGRPGDDGIEILLQPKAADGSIVDEAGNLTISLIDPAADQGERQIGQWTFLKEEALLFFAEDEFENRGILLDLKWDQVIPTNKRLTVYVRFETADERVMETTSDIIIDPPSDLSMAQQSGDYDSEFTQLDQDDFQGWYKSQTTRSRSRNEDSRDNLNWGRSEISTDKRLSRRQSSRPNRQPKWRPAR